MTVKIAPKYPTIFIRLSIDIARNASTIKIPILTFFCIFGSFYA